MHPRDLSMHPCNICAGGVMLLEFMGALQEEEQKQPEGVHP
jgi:hypothetical protein